ncbi:MAG: DPP IV N-terminal domain-containing protein, partial [Vicinamibacterales bacterium]
MPNRLRLFTLAVALTVPLAVAAQDRLKTMAGYDAARRIARDAPGAISGGASLVVWVDEGRAIEYDRDGQRYRYEIARRRATKIDAPSSDAAGRGAIAEAFDRGRQSGSTTSPDGTLKAFYKDRNLWISAADDSEPRPITTDGSAADRIKYGTASWVYGEELSQRTAMWWSPDGGKIAYYRFDESAVRDYYLSLDQTRIQATLDTEAFPMAGTPNPTVDLYVYDIATRQSVRIDVRSGKGFDDAVVGHYVYRVSWSADGRDLLFLRSNRRQNVMELAAANPSTGACRVVLREEWPTGWLVSEPRLVFLADGHHFIWESQRNGWNNFYLYDLADGLITPLTRSTGYEADKLVKIDEKAGVLFYTARDGDNPLKLQLHRVGLDGRNDRRLTDPAFHHSVGNCIPNLGARPEQPGLAGRCSMAPDSTLFVDVYQTHDTPPATRLVDATDGHVVAEIARADASRLDTMGLKRAELFTYTAGDGTTTLRGVLQFPAGFDPSKAYPMLVAVYGGPEFDAIAARETFVAPNPIAEYGFLIVNVDSRAVPGLGKRTLDAIYQKLGQAEIDDMAEGVKALWSRPYVDRARVGIFGTSYGGYASVMELLRHPEVFAAAASSSPPTDWRNYDTIYTERYMSLPSENKTGYDAGSAMSYVDRLKGRLMLYYGTADNNVHPSNMMQLI